MTEKRAIKMLPCLIPISTNKYADMTAAIKNPKVILIFCIITLGKIEQWINKNPNQITHVPVHGNGVAVILLLI